MAKEKVQSVERAFNILELLAEKGHLGVREIGHMTGLHSTVVHRILGTLVELGYVRQELETEKYFLTYKMLAVGNTIQEHNSVIQLVHPYLAALSEECRETVHFVERAGSNIRYIDKVTPPATLFLTGSYIGMELPLAGTAVGKAILAELSDDEVRNVWNNTHVVPYTVNTICDLDRLIKELGEAKKSGFAYDWEERETGLMCIGVSVPDYTGAYTYGISISAPTIRMQNERLSQIQELLKKTKFDVTNVIGKEKINKAGLK